MIPYSTIDDIVVARLDAEGSDHYDLNEDRIPAANSAQDRLAGMCVAAFEAKKFSAETLRDLLKNGIWQCSQYGRITFNPATMGHHVISVVAVMPEPEFLPGTDLTPVPMPQPYTSVYRDNLAYSDTPYSAKRLTREQWHDTKGNPFVPGNAVLTTTARKRFAYLHVRDYRNTIYQPDGAELSIRPVPSGTGRYTAVEYLKYPERIVDLTSNVEFPMHMTDLLASMSLSYLAVKQGDGTNLYGIAEADIAKQVNALGW